MEEFSKIEMAKRQLKAERLQSELLEGKLSESSMKVRMYYVQCYDRVSTYFVCIPFFNFFQWIVISRCSFCHSLLDELKVTLNL